VERRAEIDRLEPIAADRSASLRDFADLKEKYGTGVPRGERVDKAVESLESEHRTSLDELIDDAAQGLERTLVMNIGDDVLVPASGVADDLVMRVKRTGSNSIEITTATRWELMARSKASRELLWLDTLVGRRGRR